METTDKLLIVAHADDELLWAGANLAAARGWHVVASMGAGDAERRRAFARTMSWLGVSSWEMYDVREDEDSEDPDEALARYKGTAFAARLAALAKRRWTLVLTHNAAGEFGLAENAAVHALVRAAFAAAVRAGRADVRFFSADADAPLSADALADKAEAARFYAPTRAMCRRLHARDWRALASRAAALDLIRHERVHVRPRPSAPPIPAIYHQIWFGADAPPAKAHLLAKTRAAAKRSGVAYRLWGNDDLTEDAFPLTWDAMQRALAIGRETGQSRWAQVADLARLELAHRYGGAYFDSLIEVSDRMWPAILAAATGAAPAAERPATFVGCNEDPCGLDCAGAGGAKYLTNSFFACAWRHAVPRRAMRDVLDGKVDLASKYINRTTGPYFLRKCIRGDGAADGVFLFATERVYPFLVNGSEYRAPAPNACLAPPDAAGGPPEPDAIRAGERAWMIRDCLDRKYPDALAVYNSGLGGSWSW